MATRSARRALGARAILAAGILALSASIIPAHAVGEPNLVDTSVDSGWTKHATTVGATYDALLGPTSTAVLVDGDGTAVAGTVVVQNQGVAFVASAPLVGANGPYTMTWTAVSGATSASRTTVRTFSVDTAVPAPPALSNPEPVLSNPFIPWPARPSALPAEACAPEVPDAPAPIPAVCQGLPWRGGTGVGATNIAVYGPGDTITIEGTAADRLGAFDSPTYTSGIKDVTIYFYPAFKDKFDPDLTIVVPGVCANKRCATTIDFTGDNAVELVELPQGIWTISAVAHDQAGNKSGESNPVTFNKV